MRVLACAAGVIDGQLAESAGLQKARFQQGDAAVSPWEKLRRRYAKGARR